MGMFDTFNVDDCDGQVKMFDCNMDVFNIGDRVCKLRGTYSIKLRFGKWVNIEQGVWCSYTEHPKSEARFNKWGGDWDEDSPVYE